MERKLGGKRERNEWVAIRVGDFLAEEVFAGKYPSLEIASFCGEI